MTRARSRTSAPRVSALEDHLGYWLRFVSNHVSQAFVDKLATRDVTVPEWVVLRLLYDGPQNPSWLAEQLRMTRGAVSKIVDRLADKALVARARGEGDRRYQQVALTGAGRTLVPVLARLADENDAAFFGGLSAADRRTLSRVLQAIVAQSGLAEVPIE